MRLVEKDLTKVTFKRRGDYWKLTVLGLREGAKDPTVFHRARCDSLADAMDAFEDWRRGVIIV